ncbi:aldehyde dehydrogenase family protein [Streptomyces sp. GbtcB7]|uniref:aldehyde dehydrogenase family protein n=1 Tax=Streptomyces sp. GbtcB7 TaxID=2824752 RepID=UPI001C2F553C|nr:aldehyde dehydrogenase family protein [Streptomyces sp. GbtcB7]
MACTDANHYIGGTYTAPAGTGLIQVVNPATGEVFGRAADGTAEDIDTAVGSARAALPGWAARGGKERAEVMERFADAIDGAGDRLASLVSTENGMPGFLSRLSQVTASASQLRYYAGLARETPEEETRPGTIGPVVVRREPIGVAGPIVPWNYPVSLIMMKLAPALAAGCTDVDKPNVICIFDGRWRL